MRRPGLDLNTALFVGCVYELVALATPNVPTITTLLKTVARHPAGRPLLWAWCGYISWHFLEPEIDG